MCSIDICQAANFWRIYTSRSVIVPVVENYVFFQHGHWHFEQYSLAALVTASELTHAFNIVAAMHPRRLDIASHSVACDFPASKMHNLWHLPESLGCLASTQIVLWGVKNLLPTELKLLSHCGFLLMHLNMTADKFMPRCKDVHSTLPANPCWSRIHFVLNCAHCKALCKAFLV